MKKSVKITAALTLLFILFVLEACAAGGETNEFLSWFPLITFIAMAILSYLNVSMLQKQGKLKEDILNIVRQEVKEEIRELEKAMVTKEQLAAFKELSAAVLSRIELKIDIAASKAEMAAAELSKVNKKL